MWIIGTIVWVAGIFSIYWNDVLSAQEYSKVASLVPIQCEDDAPPALRFGKWCWITVHDWKALQASLARSTKTFADVRAEAQRRASLPDQDVAAEAFHETGARPARSAEDVANSNVRAAGVPPVVVLLLTTFLLWVEQKFELFSYERMLLRLWQVMTIVWVAGILLIFLAIREWLNLEREPWPESTLTAPLTSLVLPLPIPLFTIVSNVFGLFFSAAAPPMIIFAVGIGLLRAIRLRAKPSQFETYGHFLFNLLSALAKIFRSRISTIASRVYIPYR
jgi:hypothetical protein